MKEFISCLDHLGQNNRSSKVNPPPSSGQNSLYAGTHTQEKAEPLLGLGDLWPGLLEHFFLLLFKASRHHLISSTGYQ